MSESPEKRSDGNGQVQSPYSDSVTPASQISQSSLPNSEKYDDRLEDHNDQATREDYVATLARTFTNQSEQLHIQSPFHTKKGGPLDPTSPAFKAREWAKAFYTAVSSSAPRRVAGVAFSSLNVYGHGSPTDYQPSVGNIIFRLPSLVPRLFGNRERRIDILHNIEGVVHPGEMLCVLGPPGSGCSTLLKTIAGDTYGLYLTSDSSLNYQGIPPAKMHNAFRGEAIYTAEVDVHYPMLSVNDTLFFAALARAPYSLPDGVHRKFYATHLRDVIMAMFGISHTKDTPVGNDFVRGVSGGERKRVTIAEATLSNAPLQCWDNSTRGLDSANAVEFTKTLRLQSDVFGFTSCVAIYQAPQSAYDLFDKVTILYEGRQIYFGRAQAAKAYFQDLGFQCPDNQTTPDFLTSMTNPVERIIKPGYENTAPRTSEDFAARWRDSKPRHDLLAEIDAYNNEHPMKGDSYNKFVSSRVAEKSTMQRKNSPYTLSYWRQIQLCVWRDVQRLKVDPYTTIVMLIGNFFEAIIIASIFFNLPANTSSFFARGAVLFLMVLLNAFGSLIEIIGLYAKRAIVEKHNRYALYHPSAEALASLLVDMPYKVTNAIFVNSTLYFMANLRREAGAYFFFLLLSFTLTLSMSMFFRLFASITKTLAQALSPACIVLLGMTLYTGFTIPVEYMRGWASWLRFINPIYYGFESVVLNEFHGREYTCSQYIPSGPGYEDVAFGNRVCATVGAQPGSTFVSGTEYVRSTFSYVNSHRWRNFGILVAMTIGLTIAHLVVSELVASTRSKGEVLVFRRGKHHIARAQRSRPDEERTVAPVVQNEVHDSNADADTNGNATAAGVERQTAVFHWQNVSYEIKAKGQQKLILDRVDGWVKPGTLTALMGVSGAGKTTLLDVLASRTTIGVITGEMLVDGQQRDGSFQRKTGYVQQQDLHLHTSTVREALEFSALLRQPDHYSRQEKLDYVDTVIGLLNMQDYADAVVGVPGSGLNVEQRKRLTIGVELAARPSLLLFLDEPTSGLDSQTSWSICDLMEKLKGNGQAILCTIHQPSAILFQRFDRLLLLAQGGKTVYFGEIGYNSRTLVEYFVRHGAEDCPPGVNPAEYMLATIGAAPGAHTDTDWPAVWRQSNEYAQVQAELAKLRGLASVSKDQSHRRESDYADFAASFSQQLWLVLLRTFQQYWRTPSYIYSKASMAVISTLFIGFSFFRSDNTQQGLQNQMFGVFLFLFVLIQLIFMTIPIFAVQRTIYESRERQARTYHWLTFVISNVLAEIVWNSVLAVFCFVTWYYPMELYRNAEWTDSVHIRGFLTFLYVWASFLFAGTFAQALIAGAPSDEIASAVGNIMSIMMYAFCGILAGPDALPGFWIFMYRVNPFTYLVDGLLSTTLANAPVTCASNEILRVDAPAGESCGDYMAEYIQTAGGNVLNPNVVGGGDEQCGFCQLTNTNQYLSSISVNFSLRWRNFGLLWVYIVFNIGAALAFYWLFRVPRKGKAKQAK
ncbi:hypothetical protein PV10_03185 [Exophiala mesophila]|uniref:ABC transporter domain-containing protein n=1 Tax=Exophiala mesophila TaxID=212818 RepID=A0A0D1Y4G7_EXOME|nr:uncharacterized protein PV10_03185 [Exophiala mesophila]KIV95546.1 hypothetical protein PV10_03185 [Exophiala mesophila]